MQDEWSAWRMHDGGEGPPWYYKVEAIDMARDLYSCQATELHWSWTSLGGEPSPGNILTYRVYQPKGLRMLKKLMSAIPCKGRMDILVPPKGE